MSKTKEPEFVAETLDWCNQRRAEKGKKLLKKLPRGIPHDGNTCPCGKATGYFVGTMLYRHSPGSSAIGYLPEGVTRFVEAFDNGELPQYEL